MPITSFLNSTLHAPAIHIPLGLFQGEKRGPMEGSCVSIVYLTTVLRTFFPLMYAAALPTATQVKPATMRIYQMSVSV